MPVNDLSHNAPELTWIDIIDPSPEELQLISEKYNLHHYTLRDCLEPDHLPKHEEIGQTHFLITRLLTNETAPEADSIQEISNKVAIFYNDHLIITIHRKKIDFIDEVRQKYLVTNRSKTPGEIVIRILWNVLNSYDRFGISLSLQVDNYESKVFLKTLTSNMMVELYYVKRKSSVCRKLLLLTEEVINSVRTSDSVALQDVKDLHVKLLHMYGQVHEDVTSLLNTYLSMSAQKTNDVMKVLTIFSVFFMPLTFIAGIYGMNFHFMPELNSRFGYPGALILMVVTSLCIYIWFRKKKWL